MSSPIGVSRKRFTSIAGFSDQQSLRRVAKLRLGIKKGSGTSEHPVETDHFVLDVEKWVPPAIADEIRRAFRETFTERPFVISGARFASPDREIALSSDYEWWRAGKLFCHGNGVDAERKVDGKMAPWAPTNPCANNGCPDFGGKKCGAQHRVRFLLPNITLHGFFQIDTGSVNSARNINDGLNLIELLTEQIIGEPRIDRVSVILNRAPQKIEYDGKLNEHYTINLSMEPTSLAALQKALLENAPPERKQLVAAKLEIPDTEDDLPDEQIAAAQQIEEEVFDSDAEDEIQESIKLLRWNVGTVAAKQAQFPRQSEILAHVREEVKTAIDRSLKALKMPQRDETKLREEMESSLSLLADLMDRWEALPDDVRKARRKEMKP